MAMKLSLDNVVSFGEGYRQLVIIPGLSVRNFTDSAASLPGIFKRFISGWKVHVIDRPAEIAEGTTNADLAEAYFETMDGLGISGADVIGISQGGMIAQHLAVRHPSMVSRLVLGVTLARGNATSDARLDLWQELAEKGDWQALNRDTYGHLFTEAYLNRYHDAFERLIRSVKPDSQERFIRLVKACKTGGPYNELGSISCPTLVIGAAQDKVVGPDAARELAGILGCELYIFEEYGHGVYNESPEFYAKACEFISRDY